MLEPEALKTLGWVLFIGASGLTLFLGTVLAYHWYRYGSALLTISASVVYALGSIACLTLLLASVLAL